MGDHGACMRMLSGLAINSASRDDSPRACLGGSRVFSRGGSRGTQEGLARRPKPKLTWKLTMQATDKKEDDAGIIWDQRLLGFT